MKNLVKTLLIIVLGFVAIFSVVGILAYIAYYFLNGNSNLAKLISRRISGFSEEKDDLLDEDDYLNDSEEEVAAEQESLEENPTVTSQISVPENIETEIMTIEKPAPRPVVRAAAKVKTEKKTTKNKFGLNPRQSDLLKFIKNNDSSTMYDISRVFSKVTQRTLRRDLEKLEKTGLVKQDGKTRNSVYKLI